MSFGKFKSKLEKQAQKLCLTNLNCTRKIHQTNSDYEFVPYEKSVQQQSLDQSQVDTQIAFNRQKLANLNSLKKQTTQIILFNNNVEFETPDFQSTVLGNKTQDLTANPINLSQISASSEFFSESESTFTKSRDSIDGSMTASSFSDSDFQSVDTFGLGQLDESIFICHSSYLAEYDDDLSVRRSDRLQVLMVKGSFALVQNIATEDCGFVPLHCITASNEFIRRS